jgi:hypothetical protein
MSKKVSNPVAAPAPAEQVENREIVVHDTPTIRDEFAMRAMAAILTGIATSGGLAGVSVVACSDELLTKSYDFADSAMRVRAAS